MGGGRYYMGNLQSMSVARNVRAGGFINASEFEDAIVWEDGYVRCEAVQKALSELLDEGYLIQLSAGLEL